MININKKINFAFLGGEPLAVPVLQKLYENGLIPQLVVCNPDKPKGRNLEISPPPTKVWAEKNNIPYIQNLNELEGNFGLFVVVSYGKIIPKEILNLPKLGTINLHPSLLPLYRGPSPIVASILNGDSQTGVTIIKIDEEMDHGPILTQEKINLNGNEKIEDLEKILADMGGELLVKIIPEFISGNIQPREQDHTRATFVKKIMKTDGEIKLDDDQIKNWRKFRAYAHWPRTFFFKDGKRIIITEAKLENGKFVIKKVLPEGKKEIEYKDFLKR